MQDVIYKRPLRFWLNCIKYWQFSAFFHWQTRQ